MDQLAATLAAAFGLHREGRLAQAEALDRRTLDQRPHHRRALHLVGIVER